MVNGRRKGNAAEREVLKILREQFGGHWERRSMGIAGADIITPEWFPFSIEVKHVKTLRLKHIFKPTSELQKYMQQAKQQAEAEKKKHALFAKFEGVWLVSNGGIQWHAWMPILEWCAATRSKMESLCLK